MYFPIAVVNVGAIAGNSEKQAAGIFYLVGMPLAAALLLVLSYVIHVGLVFTASYSGELGIFPWIIYPTGFALIAYFLFNVAVCLTLIEMFSIRLFLSVVLALTPSFVMVQFGLFGDLPFWAACLTLAFLLLIFLSFLIKNVKLAKICKVIIAVVIAPLLIGLLVLSAAEVFGYTGGKGLLEMIVPYTENAVWCLYNFDYSLECVRHFNR